MSQAAKVGETDASFTPMSIEEARAVTDAVSGLDRDTLLAERAEAEAQLKAAQATLGIPPSPRDGEEAPTRTAPEASTAPSGMPAQEPVRQEPDEATQKTQDVNASDDALTLDVEELRQAAAAARAADDELARAASDAERRPAGDGHLGPAESALARALEIQDDLPAAWRRLVGALISATGMAIVIGALGWNIYWLLVPIALIAILTVDLRLSGKAAREVSAEAARELAAVGADGPEALDSVRLHRASLEESEARLAAARADREAAYARFEELAPGRLPSEVEEIIADHRATVAAAAASESEAAARRAAADAGRLLAESLLQDAAAEPALQPTAAPEPAPQPTAAPEPAPQPTAAAELAPQPTEEAAAAEAPEVDVEAEATAVPAAIETPAAPDEVAIPAEAAAEAPAEAPISPAAPAEEETALEPGAAVTVPETAEVPATASEWWFGSTEAPAPPAAASAPVRALAERLSAEGREALARIEAQLAALERAELAKKSLEWHKTNGSAEPATNASPESVDRTEEVAPPSS